MHLRLGMELPLRVPPRLAPGPLRLAAAVPASASADVPRRCRGDPSRRARLAASGLAAVALAAASSRGRHSRRPLRGAAVATAAQDTGGSGGSGGLVAASVEAEVVKGRAGGKKRRPRGFTPGQLMSPGGEVIGGGDGPEA